jgi:hypothetical protein
MKPENFYDVAIEVAIIRPGPIQGGLMNPYLARRSKNSPSPMSILLLNRCWPAPSESRFFRNKFCRWR